MSLDKNLKKLRKQYKLSQEELAKELKISRQAISRWEVGKTEPDIKMIQKIAKFYNVSIEELLSDEETSVKKEEKIFPLVEQRRPDLVLMGLFLIVSFLATGIPIIGILINLFALYYEKKKKTNKWHKIILLITIALLVISIHNTMVDLKFMLQSGSGTFEKMGS